MTSQSLSLSFFALALTSVTVFGANTLAAPSKKSAEAKAGASCMNLFVSVPVPSEKELKLIAQERKEAANHFKTTLRLPDGQAERQLALVLEGALPAVSPTTIADIVQNEPQAAGMARNRVIDTYAKIAKATGRTVYEGEIADALELSPEQFQELLGADRLFKDFTAVKEAAMEKKPTAFAKVIDLAIFSPERLKKLETALLNRQRFIVTTAVANSPIHQEFFATLLRAAKEMDAEILVFPANMQTMGLDPVLLETPGVHIITNSIELNSNLAINNIKLMAKMINPLMGLDDVGPRGQSQIVGSPKLHVKTVPTIDNDMNPHMLMTTGAVTQPIYNGRLYVQERTNAIAAANHVLGALIVEKSMGPSKHELPGNPKMAGFFHYRHVTYSETAKGFTDMDRFYSTNGASKASIEAITFPDVHVGEISPQFAKTLKAILKRFRPKFIAIHDLFNGHSISHHERDKFISGAKKYKAGSLDLEGELRSVVAFLNTLTSLDASMEVRVELSNHDLWLTRWLEGGHFMNEPHNRALGLELAAAMVAGHSPLETALMKFGLRNPERVIFVTETSWKAVGVELGQHGHIGANGAKGSMQTMVRAADKAVFGHSHITQRRKNIVNIATMTRLRQGYNSNGASSWSNSFATISENGEIQVFMLKEDEWWSDKKVEPGAGFFEEGYPKIIPNNDPNVGQQVDQYSRR